MVQHKKCFFYSSLFITITYNDNYKNNKSKQQLKVTKAGHEQRPHMPFKCRLFNYY